MSTPQDKHPSKSSFSDTSDDLEGAEKQIKLSGYLKPESERGGRWCSASLSNHAVKANGIHLDDNKTICSDTSISFRELEDSPWQQSSLGEYRQLQAADGAQGECIRPCVPLSLWKSTPTLNSSCDRTSQSCQFTQISETTTQSQESLTLLPQDFHVPAHQTQEAERDSNIQLLLFGEKDLDVLSRFNPASVLSNNLKELSDGDFELFLADCLWQDTLGKLRQSRQQSLGRVIKDSDYLSFPTLTSNARGTSRPAGQTKCEKWFKDNGLIPNGSQLGTKAIAMIMGFPPNWFDCLSPTEPQAESEPDISQDEQLHQHKQPLPSIESSISIPCIVKQPKQLEVKGIIQKDEGDRFLVEVCGQEISVSKLFVYPDFSKSVGQINKCSSKISTPSTDCSSKKRRHKGEGSGHIYYRTVTRNNKDYQQAYYQWRENGKQRTKYIPKKLLDRVEEAESQKLPVSDILFLLVGTGKCSSKKSDTSIISTEDKVIDTSDKCSSKAIPTSKVRRDKGKGSGWIQCKPIKRSGKEYQQYWYNYEEWRKGDRITKKSRYIPKRLVARVEKMNDEKAPVEEILRVLRNRSKRKQC